MRILALALLGVALLAGQAAAQHDHGAPRPGEPAPLPLPGPWPVHHMRVAGVLGIPDSREGSGTAWLPDATPMHALHGEWGRWTLGVHGVAFVQYLRDGGERGRSQLGSINWLMGMARRPLAGGELALRGMVSAEPLTVGRCGYPDLLATGETCHGERLHDRQHPHEAFMELALRYDRPLGRGLALQLYGGPAGEPALGPVAYPHRPSAALNTLAPISHHWQDATHIAFGVATAGLYSRRWKLEASAFNGREPDEHRWDLDLDRMDSYAARLWLAPSQWLALQVSMGFLDDAERVPGEGDGARADVHRSTASASFQRPLGSARLLTGSLVVGRNSSHGSATGTALLESTLHLNRRDAVFGRAELAGKSHEDLALPDTAAPERIFRVGKLTLGVARQFPSDGLLPGIGAALSLGFVPGALDPAYGGRVVPGLAVFATVRPAAMRAAGMALVP